MQRVLKLLVPDILFALAITLLSFSSVRAQTLELYTEQPLCLPDAYRVDPVDCLALGPSTRLTEMAKFGLSVPARPLPAVNPDPALNTSPVSIARINLEVTEKAPLYASFADATQQVNPVRFIDPGKLR